MELTVKAFVILVTALHFWFMILEMFLWQKPLGRKTFRTSEAEALATARLAKNQGLYNGFLAAGLATSLITQDANLAHAFQVFFLSCVVAAGAYGALTVNKKILFVQALPAAIPLILLYL